MKSLLLSLIFLVFSVITHSQTANLSVQISDIKSVKGNLLIGLYNNGLLFPKKESAIAGEQIKIDSKTMTYTFKNLQKGKYAIAIIHDEDMDGELSTNFLGIPTEGFGFSNNAIGTFGPPKFEKAAVLLEKDLIISIKPRY